MFASFALPHCRFCSCPASNLRLDELTIDIRKYKLASHCIGNGRLESSIQRMHPCIASEPSSIWVVPTLLILTNHNMCCRCPSPKPERVAVQKSATAQKTSANRGMHSILCIISATYSALHAIPGGGAWRRKAAEAALAACASIFWLLAILRAPSDGFLVCHLH